MIKSLIAGACLFSAPAVYTAKMIEISPTVISADYKILGMLPLMLVIAIIGKCLEPWLGVKT